MALEQPKKPVGGAYGQFIAEKRPEFTKQCAGQKASAVVKLAGEEWKKLGDEERSKYHQLYEEAKKKYNADLGAFLEAGGQKHKRAKAARKAQQGAKAGKLTVKPDPNKPKRPAAGAFGCFLSARRADFMKDSGGSLIAFSRMASARWKELPDSEKEPFDEEYRKKKTAYDEAMNSYVPSSGAADDGDADDDTEATASPPKMARICEEGDGTAPKAQAKTEAFSSQQQPNVDIPQAVFKQARRAGLADMLTKLLAREDVQAKSVQAEDALAALKKSKGLLHPARQFLLGNA